MSLRRVATTDKHFRAFPWVETHGYHRRSLRDQIRPAGRCFADNQWNTRITAPLLRSQTGRGMPSVKVRRYTANLRHSHRPRFLWKKRHGSIRRLPAVP